MERVPVPEDYLTDDESPLVKIDLKCNQCGQIMSEEFEWVCVDVERRNTDKESDGIVVSHIVTCPVCGSVDDYKVDGPSKIGLSAKILRLSEAELKNARVIPSACVLYDGTYIHRPSQAIARLREIVEQNPRSAEAYQRLGNAYERWGLLNEGVDAWEKALKLDPEKIESAYSLSTYYLYKANNPQASFKYFRHSIHHFASALKKDAKLDYLAEPLVNLLQILLDISVDQIALMAAWTTDGTGRNAHVTMSSVDLRRVGNYRLLADFMLYPNLLGLDLSPEIPEDSPTILERLLSGENKRFQDWGGVAGSETVFLPPQPIRVQEKTGRNDPCPCGSGKKYKKCCLKNDQRDKY